MINTDVTKTNMHKVMNYDKVCSELATLRAENKTMRRELMAIQSLYEEGTIAHHRAKEALK